MTTRHELAIQRELARVERRLKACPDDHRDREALYGAQQALSWALGEDAMLPSWAFPGPGGAT